MRTRGLVLIAAFAAALLLHAAPVEAYVPQVHIEAQIAEVNADDLIGRTPLAFQYTVTRAVRDYAAPRLDITLPVRGELAFNNYEFRSDGGEAWTALGAYERSVNAWGWGVQVPEQYWTPDEFDEWLFEGVTPYAYYNVNEVARVGAFGHFNYVFSDVEAAEELSWGLGAFGSYKFSVTDAFTFTPTAVYTHYAAGQDNWDDSDILSLGTRLKFALKTDLNLYTTFFYTADATNDAGDDSFWEWEAGVNYRASEKFKIMAGFGTTEGYEDFKDAWTFRLGARLKF